MISEIKWNEMTWNGTQTLGQKGRERESSKVSSLTLMCSGGEREMESDCGLCVSV